MIPLAQTTSAKPQDVPEVAIRFLEEKSSRIPDARDVPCLKVLFRGWVAKNVKNGLL